MTKKDYVLIAKRISALRVSVQNVLADPLAPFLLKEWIDGTMDELEKNNPAFNRKRFLQACGV